MKALVGEWISNLAIIAILAALVDMILPNGSLRKYTGFIFGLVILVMFLSPLLNLKDQAMQFNSSVFRNMLAQSTEAAIYQSSQTEKSQKEKIEQMLKANLEKELALSLNYKAGIKDADVKIYFGKHKGETDLSSIERIEIFADFNDRPITIDTIVINAGDEHNTAAGSNEDRKISEIREYISSLYGINESHIYINRK